MPQIPTLTPELVFELADLEDADDGYARFALAGYHVGDRMLLIAHGIVDEAALRGDDPDLPVITDYGREVIQACAASAYGTAREHAAR